MSVLFNTDRCHLSLVAKTSEYGVWILYEEKMGGGGLCLSGYFSELAFCLSVLVSESVLSVKSASRH